MLAELEAFEKANPVGEPIFKPSNNPVAFSIKGSTEVLSIYPILPQSIRLCVCEAGNA